MEKQIYDVLVIGAGITGSLISRELSKYVLKVAVIEKSNDVGNSTTSANSAIIHSGYDPLPGTNKAKFNVLGNSMYDQICKELDVDFKRIGSLTIATSIEQIETLKFLKNRSEENGVDVQLLNKEEIQKMEPNITNAQGALFAPTAGIIDPFNLCIHAMENAVDNGVDLFLSRRVGAISKEDGLFKVETNNETFYSKVVINASGTHAEKIAKLLHPIDWQIIAKKGEYFVLDHNAMGLVNHVIFPLPSEKGKGVLVSPTTGSNIIVGPSSDPVDDVDDVSTDKETMDNIRRQAEIMVPNIPFKYLIKTFAGLRPSSSRHDFIIEKDELDDRFINVAGIESPGLASSPAIAKYVVEELVSSLLSLNKKESFNPYVKGYTHIKNMNDEEKATFIANNPEYGQIVCNCEQISLGEIKETLSSSVPPRSVKGMKRRLRTGFGKCQGGFCQPKIVLLLAKHYGVSPLDIPLNDEGSYILSNTVKEAK